MLPRMSAKRYRDWLELAKSGNQAMIRVWGGGLVESENFYSACDELGILVWQDFLFACGNYPAEKGFVEEVKVEAEQQVKRVGHHTSLAIWAGNNEDYMVAERWGWDYDPEDNNPENWEKTDFPARTIYEIALPEICQRLAGDVPYWRSSPYGGKTSNDKTIGDVHIWNGNLSLFHLIPLRKLIRGNSLARQNVSLPILQRLHQPLRLRIWLRIRTFSAHPPRRHHRPLRTPLAVSHLRRPRQRARAPTPLRHVLGRELPLPVQSSLLFCLLFPIPASGSYELRLQSLEKRV